MSDYSTRHAQDEVKIYARVKNPGCAPQRIEIGPATRATQDQYTDDCIATYGDILVGVYAIDEHAYAFASGAVKRLHKGPAC